MTISNMFQVPSLFKSKFPKLRVFGFDMISLTSKLNRGEGKKAHQKFLIEINKTKNLIVMVLKNINH